MRQTQLNILLALLLLVFIGQSTASIAMSCSMMMSSPQTFVNTINKHEANVAGAEANDIHSMHAGQISHQSSSENIDQTSEHHSNMMKTNLKDVPSCCLDQCSCAVGTCHSYKTSNVIAIVLGQTSAEEKLSAFMPLPETSFLSYLFKPPIQA